MPSELAFTMKRSPSSTTASLEPFRFHSSNPEKPSILVLAHLRLRILPLAHLGGLTLRLVSLHGSGLRGEELDQLPKRDRRDGLPLGQAIGGLLRLLRGGRELGKRPASGEAC